MQHDDRELEAARRLAEVSTRLIQAEGIDALYEEILDTAVSIMQADFASLQVLHAERGPEGELELLGHRGFDDAAARFWTWVAPRSGSACSEALVRGRRVVVADLEAPPPFIDAGNLANFRANGIRAVQTTPLVSRVGRVLGMISTQWRAPTEPTDGQLRLFDVLARQAADLIERSRAEQSLREAVRHKDAFVSMLAHELRNPLAPLRNGLEIVRLRHGDDPVTGPALVMMERQLGHMVGRVEDLLDVSRIRREKLRLDVRPVSLATVVRDAVEIVRPRIEEAGHVLRVEGLDDAPVVDGDESRLVQCVANLLDNAARYTDGGGHLRLAVARERQEATVTVEDDGIGIPAAMLPRVFEMFMQVDRSLDRAQGGLGIGLSIVKSVIEAHGGAVEAHSEGRGRGSRFTLRLPARTAAVGTGDEAGAGEAGREAARTVRRVLVVDDNVDAATSLALLLRLMGHETLSAHDGHAALELAADWWPDVVLLDLGMPGLDGLETARRMRGSSWGRAAVLVALTGWGEEEDRRRSREAGLDHHLIKPVDPALLSNLLTGLPARSADGRAAPAPAGDPSIGASRPAAP